jgi:PKD repeat protein
MTATTGSDATGPVEYFFDETSGNPGGTDSAWQTSASYTDTGLTASTQYTYTVQMRDALSNTGTASAPANATTDDPPPDTDPPTANFIADNTTPNTNQSVSFTDQSSGSPTSWLWNFGDGGTSTANNPSHTYTVAGTYTVSLTATNAQGSDTVTETVTVTDAAPPPPTPEGFMLSKNADFSTEDRGYLLADTMNMKIWSDRIDYTDMRKAEYEIKVEGERVKGSLTNNGDGTFTAVQPLSGLPTGSGTVKLKLEGNDGVKYEERDIPITVTEGAVSPVAAFSGSPTSGQADLAVSFTDQSSGSPTSWSWDFGDTGTSTAQNPSHTYSTAETYTVSLTATNAQGSDTLTRTNYITVTLPSPPTATFVADDTTPNTNQAVSFTDQSSGSPTSWEWDFGDTGTSTAQNPSHTYSTAETYTVSLTSTNAQGSDTLTRTNYITVTEAAPPPPTPEGFILSKNADFSTDDRVFSRSETIYMKMWSDGVDSGDIKRKELELKDPDRNRVKQNFDNNGDGTFTAAFALDGLPSDLTAWEWKGKLEDNARNKYQVTDNITVNP